MRLRVAIAALVAGYGMIAANPLKAQAVCAGTRLALKTPALTSKPYVDLALDGKTGPWLVDYGLTSTAVSADVWQKPANGGRLSLPGFGFPGVGTAAREFSVEPGAGRLPTIGLHHGDLGTDLLSLVTAEFRFDDANDPAIIVSKTACDPSTATGGPFLRIAQPDFFGAASSRRGSKCPVPESALAPSDPKYVTPVCPNVPIVYIDIEERAVDKTRPTLANPKRGARTFAQIDTGYGDPYWPFSVDINEPYLKELQKLAPSLMRVGLVPVSGCGNEDSLREVWAAPGWKLNVVNESGQKLPGRYFDSYYFVVKPTRTKCGGIGRMTVPAAQLGASFLRAFGTTIFMPTTSEVWIRTP